MYLFSGRELAISGSQPLLVASRKQENWPGNIRASYSVELEWLTRVGFFKGNDDGTGSSSTSAIMRTQAHPTKQPP